MQKLGNIPKLLIIVPGIPHESSGASVVLFYYYIKALKDLNLYTLNILIIQPDNINEDHLSSYINKLSSPGKFEIIPMNFNHQLIESSLLSFRINSNSYSRVFQQVNDFHPDIIICFDLLSVWLVSKISYAKKIVWLGDLNFQTYWYNILYSIAERNHPYLKILPLITVTWLRCREWKKIYFNLLSQTTSIVVSSKSSEMHLKKIGLDSTYIPYPWPNLLEHKSEEPNLPKKPTFLFYGTLKATGSRSAFQFMIHKLYPKIVNMWGSKGFKIIITGRGGLYPWVEKALIGKPEFEYLGFVENLITVMKSCHAVLMPIDVPVGNRSRIITAMANNILVIAHKNTSLGNPELVDDKTCLLASNVKEFVNKMNQSVSCYEKINRIVNNARQVYLTRFHPKSATKLFIDHIIRNLRKEEFVLPLPKAKVVED